MNSWARSTPRCDSCAPARLVVDQRAQRRRRCCRRRARCRRPRRRRPRAATGGGRSAPRRRRPSPRAPAGRSPPPCSGRRRPSRRRAGRAGRPGRRKPGRTTFRCGGTSAHGLVDAVVPAAAAGEHQRRRVVHAVDGRTQPRTRSGTFLRRSSTPRNATYGWPCRPSRSVTRRRLGLRRRVEASRCRRRGGRRRSGRVGVEQPDQLVAGRLRGHDDPAGAAHRGAGGRPVEAGLHRAVQLGLGEERDVVHGDHHRHRRVQRHRVVRRVDEVGADLLGDQRQPGLLPGQPGRPVRDRRRARARSRRRRRAGGTARRRRAGRRRRGPARRPHSAPTRPSTYRPTPPRSAGTAVASRSTRGAPDESGDTGDITPLHGRLLAAYAGRVAASGTPAKVVRKQPMPTQPRNVRVRVPAVGCERCAAGTGGPGRRPGCSFRRRPSRPTTAPVGRLAVAPNGARPARRNAGCAAATDRRALLRCRCAARRSTSRRPGCRRPCRSGTGPARRPR